MTTAVCVKVANLRRLGYTDLEEWINDDENVYVGRRGRIWIHSNKGEKRIFHYIDSKWRNPFKLPEHDLDTSLSLYKQHLDTSGLINQIDELRGKNLGCFCSTKKIKNKPMCHAQILADILEFGLEVEDEP